MNLLGYNITAEPDSTKRMEWHVTGKNPDQEEPVQENFMNRLVQWLRNQDEGSFFAKVGCCALWVLSTLSFGYALGQTFLVFIAVNAPVVAWAGWETLKIKEKEEAVQKQQEAFAKMKEIFGQEAYDALPVLDIGDRCGPTGYLDFLKTEDLEAPIMKGKDKVQRPFIALKLHDHEQGCDFVLTLFQRYSEEALWTFSRSSNHRGVHFLNTSLGEKDRNIIGQIFRGEHSRFRDIL